MFIQQGEYALSHLIDEHTLITLAEALDAHALSLCGCLTSIGRTPQFGSLDEAKSIARCVTRLPTSYPLDCLQEQRFDRRWPVRVVVSCGTIQRTCDGEGVSGVVPERAEPLLPNDP